MNCITFIGFFIDINSVNDSPEFDFINFLQLEEDFSQLVYSPAPKPIPADELNQVVTYSITPDPSTISFIDLSFDEVSGLTVINAIPDSSGIVTLTIVADDGQPENNTSEQKLYIEVIPKNDSPRIVNLANELSINQNENTIFEIPEDAFLDPEDGKNLTITIDLDGGPLPYWIIYDNITRTISFNPDDLITGNYQVSINATDTEFESVTSVLTVSVLLVTNMEETSLFGQGSLYPNPASNEINIPIHLEENGNLMIRITDLSGKIIRQWIEYHEEGELVLQKNVSGLRDGFYLIKINGPGITVENQFIKHQD